MLGVAGHVREAEQHHLVEGEYRCQGHEAQNHRDDDVQGTALADPVFFHSFCHSVLLTGSHTYSIVFYRIFCRLASGRTKSTKRCGNVTALHKK